LRPARRKGMGNKKKDSRRMAVGGRRKKRRSPTVQDANMLIEKRRGGKGNRGLLRNWKETIQNKTARENQTTIL